MNVTAVDDKVYRLLADLSREDLGKLMASPVGFQVKLQEYPEDPVSLQPDSEEEAEGATDAELIMAAAAAKWHTLPTAEREAFLKLVEGAGGDAAECKETLELWET